MTKEHVPVEYVRTWRGVSILIRYRPRYLGVSEVAHLEVQSIEPKRQPLPITKTGYRSHFFHPWEGLTVEAIPQFVLDWLEDEATGEAWKEKEAELNQLSLF